MVIDNDTKLDVEGILSTVSVSILCVRVGLSFLKPFLKGKILRSSERGVNSILTTILRF